MKMTTECIFCSLNMMNKNFKKINADEKSQVRFIKQACEVIANADEDTSPPEINNVLMQIIAKEVGTKDMFVQEKHSYNEAIMRMEGSIWEHIKKADDKLYRALQYAMTGNYIDFGVSSSVSEEKLHELIESAVEIDLGSTYEKLKKDLENAKSLVYLLDNCGEIVFDKMCIKEIKRLYPNLEITAVVRGLPTYNDALMADADQTGLTDIVSVVDNGSDIPGTVINKIKKSTKALIEQADVVIAKGMGNYETLEGCGLNVYYIFLCKCERFVIDFGVPKYTGLLVYERE